MRSPVDVPSRSILFHKTVLIAQLGESTIRRYNNRLKLYIFGNGTLTTRRCALVLNISVPIEPKAESNITHCLPKGLKPKRLRQMHEKSYTHSVHIFYKARSVRKYLFRSLNVSKEGQYGLGG